MKKLIFTLCCLLLIFNVFANEATHNFSVTTDFAFYPDNTPVVLGEDSDDIVRFSPITGPYKSLEARAVVKHSYKIPTPFSDNPLVKGNNLQLNSSLELTPISIAPQFGVTFVPIAFLNFSASAKIGTAWNMLGFRGFADLESNEAGYTNLDNSSEMFYEFKFSNLFQFDLGAIIPGDWTHVVTMATYDIIYTGLTGIESGEPWLWQSAGEKATGWNYYSNIILGYQMPLVLQTVGVQFEFSGYYNNNVLNAEYQDWNPTFSKICINPVCILKFNDKNALTIQANFASRRGFSESAGTDATNFNLDYNGREWYFNRVALSYTYTF